MTPTLSSEDHHVPAATGDARTDTAALAAAAGSGSQHVHLTPGPTAYASSARIQPVAGQSWEGHGATISGEGFRAADDWQLRDVTLDAGGSDEAFGVQQPPGVPAAQRWSLQGVTFRGHRNAVHLAQGSDGALCSGWTIQDCTFGDFVYGVHGAGNDGTIAGNTFSSTVSGGTVASAAVGFVAGMRNRVTDNKVDGNMWVGIGYAARADQSPMFPFMHNEISGNTLSGVTQESISLDCNASNGDHVSVREQDTVASCSASGGATTLTLSSPGWSAVDAPYRGYWVAFGTGALAGEIAEITAQSGATLTLDLPPGGAARVATGDVVLIGCPSAYNSITGNTIDASSTTTFAIAVFGFCFRNTVQGNTFQGNQGQGGIVVSTLGDVPAPKTTGPAAGGAAVTSGSRVALSAHNTVSGNQGRHGPIADVYRQAASPSGNALKVLPVGNDVEDNPDPDLVVYARDSFARADTTTNLTGNDCRQFWSRAAADGVWGIKDHEAYLVSAGTGTIASTRVETGHADGTLSVTLVRPADDVGLSFRALNGRSAWLATGSGLWKVEGGVRTTVASWPALTGRPTLEVSLQGSAIEVRSGGAVLATADDPFHQDTTQHGMGGTTTATTGQLAAWRFAP